MTTVSHGKPYAGNPHVRFEEGASESAKPSRNALLHTQYGFGDEALCGLQKDSRDFADGL